MHELLTKASRRSAGHGACPKLIMQKGQPLASEYEDGGVARGQSSPAFPVHGPWPEASAWMKSEPIVFLLKPRYDFVPDHAMTLPSSTNAFEPSSWSIPKKEANWDTMRLDAMRVVAGRRDAGEPATVRYG
jgi:hypothetical protein